MRMRKLLETRVVPGSAEMAIESSSESVATMLLLPLFGCPTIANVGCAASSVFTRLSRGTFLASEECPHVHATNKAWGHSSKTRNVPRGIEMSRALRGLHVQ